MEFQKQIELGNIQKWKNKNKIEVGKKMKRELNKELVLAAVAYWSNFLKNQDSVVQDNGGTNAIRNDEYVS